MTEIKKLENEMILLERMIDKNNLLPKDFLINNVFFACKDASSEYQFISVTENFISQSQPQESDVFLLSVNFFVPKFFDYTLLNLFLLLNF